jgi:hypothetical protein
MGAAGRRTSGEVSDPSLTAVKTLFALSRNICFFTGCEERLTDPKWRTVNAEVAHIKGENPGSARYDEYQSDAERQGFDNLMLLCPKHHKLVDKLRPDEYPVDRLQGMKERHLEHEAESGWLSEEQAEQFAAQLIAELSGTAVSVQAQAGSAVSFQAQAGGAVVDVRALDAFVVPEEPSLALSGAGATEERTTGVPGESETPRDSSLTLIEHDDGSLVLANEGHTDAFTISVRVVGQPHSAVGHPRGVFGGPGRVLERPHGVELAAIPPPRLSPGESWTAGYRRRVPDDSGQLMLLVSWTDRSGAFFERDFQLR